MKRDPREAPLRRLSSLSTSEGDAAFAAELVRAARPVEDVARRQARVWAAIERAALVTRFGRRHGARGVGLLVLAASATAAALAWFAASRFARSPEVTSPPSEAPASAEPARSARATTASRDPRGSPPRVLASAPASTAPTSPAIAPPPADRIPSPPSPPSKPFAGTEADGEESRGLAEGEEDHGSPEASEATARSPRGLEGDDLAIGAAAMPTRVPFAEAGEPVVADAGAPELSATDLALPPLPPEPTIAPRSDEATLVLFATRALRRDGDARGAARLLSFYRQKYPRGVLEEEALALAIEAAAAFDEGEALRLATRYLARFPGGRFAARARAAIEEAR